jgi:hypothetical protein
VIFSSAARARLTDAATDKEANRERQSV